MAIELSRADFDRLAGILSRQDIWRDVHGRWDFMTEVLAGSDRKDDLGGSLNLDGSVRGTAVRVIERLCTFGQDAPGRESIGVLVNRLIREVGAGEDAEFLRDLFARYPFETQPVVREPRAARWQGRDTAASTAEAIIGENTLQHVRILDLLRDASRAVVRIEGPNGMGTGFMVAEDLVLTNHHVIGSDTEALDCEFTFNYQLDRAGRIGQTAVAHAKRGGDFVASPYDPSEVRNDALDYTIVQLADPPPAPDVFEPLTVRAGPIRRDARVSIIQHPAGDYKKISMHNNFVAYSDEVVVQYTTSTEAGSSGSPVLNDKVQVVAVHHAGSENMLEPRTGRRYFRNEGILAQAIVNDLRLRRSSVLDRLKLV